MENVKTKQRRNEKTASIEFQPLVKQLNSLHRSGIAKLQTWHQEVMVRRASSQCQSRETDENLEPPIFGLLGTDSLSVEIQSLMAGSVKQEKVSKPREGLFPLQSTASRVGERRLRNLTNQRDCVPRIEKFYKEVVCFDLLLQCPLKSIMELSPSNKIVLNSSSKKIIQDKKELIVGLSACLIISGERCQTTWARKSIAGFKLREGSVIGCKVTLRGSSIYSFIEKLINFVLPRARPSSITQGIGDDGTYNIGVSDPFLFLELEQHYDLFQSLQGFDIALVMSPKEKGLIPLFWSGLQLLPKQDSKGGLN